MSNRRTARRRRPYAPVSVAAGRLVPQRDPILRQIAAPADPDDPVTAATGARLAVALAQIKIRAVAIAAPQIGVGLRIVVFATDVGLDDPRKVFLNPTVEALDGPTIEDVEGCLSLPGRWYTVARPARVRIRATLLGESSYDDVEWETGGLVARAWCHEVAHLDGILISDVGTPARIDKPRHVI